jgi:hypothetical protein
LLASGKDRDVSAIGQSNYEPLKVNKRIKEND